MNFPHGGSLSTSLPMAAEIMRLHSGRQRVLHRALRSISFPAARSFQPLRISKLRYYRMLYPFS